MNSREFHLGDILCITDGHLVSQRGIAGVYDILNFMTGESLFTHALIRASKVCKPVLLQQHPDLAAVDGSEVTTGNWRAWLERQVALFGEYRSVQPLSSYEHKDPVTELVDMGVGLDRIISIDTTGGGS